MIFYYKDLVTKMCITPVNKTRTSAKPNTTDWKSVNLKKTKMHVTNYAKTDYAVLVKNGDKKESQRTYKGQLVRSYSATISSSSQSDCNQ